MTSVMGVEHPRERRFRFQCPCGKDIVTNKKEVTCACGKTMEVKLVRKRRLRHNPKSLPLLCTGLTVPRESHTRTNSEYHQLFCNMATTPHSRRHRLESPDRHEHYLPLGFLFLLAPIWLPLLWTLLSSISASVLPGRERPYHYERHDIHVIDSRGGGHTIPKWTRVDD